MIYKARKLLALLAVIQLSSCAVIHFENGETVPDPNPGSSVYTLWLFDEKNSDLNVDDSIRFREWVSHGFYQVAEISNPLDFSKACTGLEWNQVTTEITPFDALVGLLDNLLLLNASSAGIDLWSHWSLEYSCRTH